MEFVLKPQAQLARTSLLFGVFWVTLVVGQRQLTPEECQMSWENCMRIMDRSIAERSPNAAICDGRIYERYGCKKRKAAYRRGDIREPDEENAAYRPNDGRRNNVDYRGGDYSDDRPPVQRYPSGPPPRDKPRGYADQPPPRVSNNAGQRRPQAYAEPPYDDRRYSNRRGDEGRDAEYRPPAVPPARDAPLRRRPNPDLEYPSGRGRLEPKRPYAAEYDQPRTPERDRRPTYQEEDYPNREIPPPPPRRREMEPRPRQLPPRRELPPPPRREPPRREIEQERPPPRREPPRRELEQERPPPRREPPRREIEPEPRQPPPPPSRREPPAPRKQPQEAVRSPQSRRGMEIPPQKAAPASPPSPLESPVKTLPKAVEVVAGVATPVVSPVKVETPAVTITTPAPPQVPPAVAGGTKPPGPIIIERTIEKRVPVKTGAFSTFLGSFGL